MFADFFPGKAVIGLPHAFRIMAQALQINCADRKVLITKSEYLDQESNLLWLAVPTPLQPIDVKDGTIFGMLLNLTCGAQVAGTYEGTNNVTYEKGEHGEQKISVIVEQAKDTVNVSFQTADGGQGKGSGALTGTTVDPIKLQSTNPACPGTYQGSLKFANDTISWSYKGEDCGGPMQGQGTAKKAKS